MPRAVDTKGANTLAYFVPSNFFQTSLTYILAPELNSTSKTYTFSSNSQGANTQTYFVPCNFFLTSLTVRLDCRATNGMGTRKYQTILSQG